MVSAPLDRLGAMLDGEEAVVDDEVRIEVTVLSAVLELELEVVEVELDVDGGTTVKHEALPLELTSSIPSIHDKALRLRLGEK